MTAILTNRASFERPSLVREEVYQHLREAVLGGEFSPGERLAESELAARLGVSRTPVREALMRLTQDKLLETEANKGVRMRSVNAQEARDTYLVRGELDGLAAALAASAHTPQDADTLQAALSALEQTAPGDYRQQTLLDLAFHRSVVEAAHNSVLAALSRDLEVRVALIKHQTRSFNAYPATHAQHSAIAQAVLNRDPQAARQAAETHVATFAELVMREFESLPSHLPAPNEEPQ